MAYRESVAGFRDGSPATPRVARVGAEASAASGVSWSCRWSEGRPWRLQIRRDAADSDSSKVTLGEVELEWLLSPAGREHMALICRGRPSAASSAEGAGTRRHAGAAGSQARSRSASVGSDELVTVFVRSFLLGPVRMERIRVCLGAGVAHLRTEIAYTVGTPASEVVLRLGSTVLEDTTGASLASVGLRQHSEVVATRRLRGGGDDGSDLDAPDADVPLWVCTRCLTPNWAGLECMACGFASPHLGDMSSEDGSGDEPEAEEPFVEEPDEELVPPPGLPPQGPMGVAVLGMDGAVWVGVPPAEPAAAEVPVAGDDVPPERGAFGIDEEPGVPRMNGHTQGPLRMRVLVTDIPTAPEPMGEFSFDGETWFGGPDPFAGDGSSSNSEEIVTDTAAGRPGWEIGGASRREADDPPSLAAFLAANALPAEGYPGRASLPFDRARAAASQGVTPSAGASSGEVAGRASLPSQEETQVQEQVRGAREERALLRQPPGGDGSSGGGGEQ